MDWLQSFETIQPKFNLGINFSEHGKAFRFQISSCHKMIKFQSEYLDTSIRGACQDGKSVLWKYSIRIIAANVWVPIFNRKQKDLSQNLGPEEGERNYNFKLIFGIGTLERKILDNRISFKMFICSPFIY